MSQSSTAAKHNEFVEHHFIDADQQLDTAKMGMWIFLATEILFFGGLFAAYAIYRIWYPELFVQASHELDVVMGTVNTVVLIFSSLTVAFAIRATKLDLQRQTIIWLTSTILLACVFMVIKYFEWTHKFHLGIFPGEFYAFDGIDHAKAPLFFSLYYVMTGMHGLHVIIGIGLMIWLLINARKGKYHSKYYNPVEITGLYWHLVDVIWIFLFPLFYLIG